MSQHTPAETSRCCEGAVTRVRETDLATQCATCGTWYLPPDDDPANDLGARESAVELVAHVAPRPPPLAEVLAEVELALAWRHEHAAVAGARTRSPIARAQGHASGADDDATALEVTGLWRLVTTPHTKVGARARTAFVDALLRYARDTSRDEDRDAAIDWNAARRHAETLASLDAAHRTTLTRLARRVVASVTWDVAVLVVADECASPALRARWVAVHRAPGAVGRPRVDRGAPPPERAAAAWGDDALRAALAAWSGAGARERL